VVASGAPTLEVIEYSVETSSNIEITFHELLISPGPMGPELLGCGQDAQHSYRAAAVVGVLPSPLAVARVDYDLLDANPA
jgi:hypothetical protein